MNDVQRGVRRRIGKDAEVRSTSDGKPWAFFPVAVDISGDGGRRRVHETGYRTGYEMTANRTKPSNGAACRRHDGLSCGRDMR